MFYYKMKQLALILACLISMDALACRFNVRDVGFVDLGSEPYRLFIFVPEGTPNSEIELLESTAYATYLDSNVKATVLSPKDALKSKASEFVPRELTQAQAVLESPEPPCRWRQRVAISSIGLRLKTNTNSCK